MSIFFNRGKNLQKTLTQSRFFLGVMIDPEVDSYFVIQSKIFNSSKSEEVRKELKKAYEIGISNAIRNIVRKILISIDDATKTTISRDDIRKELRKQGIHVNHIERIIELLWKELKDQSNH